MHDFRPTCNQVDYFQIVVLLVYTHSCTCSLSVLLNILMVFFIVYIKILTQISRVILSCVDFTLCHEP